MKTRLALWGCTIVGMVTCCSPPQSQPDVVDGATMSQPDVALRDADDASDGMASLDARDAVAADVRDASLDSGDAVTLFDARETSVDTGASSVVDTSDYRNIEGLWDVPGADGVRWSFEAVSHCTSSISRFDGGVDAAVDASSDAGPACAMYQLCAGPARPALYLILFGPTAECYEVEPGGGEPPSTYAVRQADAAMCLRAGITCGAFGDASSPPLSKPEREGTMLRVRP